MAHITMIKYTFPKELKNLLKNSSSIIQIKSPVSAAKKIAINASANCTAFVHSNFEVIFAIKISKSNLLNSATPLSVNFSFWSISWINISISCSTLLMVFSIRNGPLNTLDFRTKSVLKKLKILFPRFLAHLFLLVIDDSIVNINIRKGAQINLDIMLLLTESKTSITYIIKTPIISSNRTTLLLPSASASLFPERS